jgi:outer membrane protein assembly factor BamB
MVFIVTMKVSVRALRASDGSQLWETQIDNSAASSLAVDGDLLYVGSRSLIESLQASTGHMLWHKDASRGYEGAWAASNGVFYLGTDVSLQAFQGKDGTQLWQTAISAPSISTVTATDDTVYFVTGYTLKAVQASSGHLVWQHSISRLNGGYRHALAASEEAVYIGIGGLIRHGSGCDSHYSNGFAVEAVRPADGSLLWSFQV